MVPYASAQNRCQEVLDPNSCTLNDCQKACYEKHTTQQPRGECIADANFKYSCICFFNC
ncbi:hypothetical protein BT93_F0659 [Corymbia citriodora subsp. variegata]|nr:hypothetical protein BT93_F0659 [Corymbia citriodora subsp. variegata]